MQFSLAYILDRKSNVAGYYINFDSDNSSMASFEVFKRVHSLKPFKTNVFGEVPLFCTIEPSVLREVSFNKYENSAPYFFYIVTPDFFVQSGVEDDSLLYKELKKLGFKFALYVTGPDSLSELSVLESTYILCGQDSNLILDSSLQQYIAWDVETLTDYMVARDKEYHLFYGRFINVPILIDVDEDIKANELVVLRLIEQANKIDDDYDVIRIAEIIQQDPTLSLNMLKLINSLHFGLRRKVTNIKSGVVLLGRNELQRWCSALALEVLSTGKPNHLLMSALIRARMLELSAKDTGLSDNAGELFLLGLLTLSDSIMETSLEKILETISVDCEIENALVEQDSIYSKNLQMILSYMEADWNKANELRRSYGLGEEWLTALYTDALIWYTDIML